MMHDEKRIIIFQLVEKIQKLLADHIENGGTEHEAACALDFAKSLWWIMLNDHPSEGKTSDLSQ
jgi:flagellar biosynthesis regulator FlaF